MGANTRTTKGSTRTRARSAGNGAPGRVVRFPLAELVPDDDNNNDGTERGVSVLESSLTRCGAGRSITLDKHNRIISGNKTVEAAASIGLPLVVVESDGRSLVAVRRTDLDLRKDKRARELAIADNRAAEVGLQWNPASVLRAQERGVELAPYFNEPELRRMFDAAALPAPGDELPNAGSAHGNTHTCPSCGHVWEE